MCVCMCVCVSWAGKAETVSLTPTMFVMRTCDFQVNGREENLKLHLAERKSQKYPGALGSSQFTPRCTQKISGAHRLSLVTKIQSRPSNAA